MHENFSTKICQSAVSNETELQRVLKTLEAKIEDTFDKYQRLENKLQTVLMPQSPQKEAGEDRCKMNSEITENIQAKADRLNSINDMLMDLIKRLVV